MRWLALTLCLISAGCAFSGGTIPGEAEPPPDTAAALAGLKATAAEAKLAEPLEVSQVMEAPANLTPRWQICLRSGASEETRKRVYSVLFSKNAYNTSRPSVIVERCEAQTFVPLESAYPPPPPVPPPIPQSVRRRGAHTR
jgi:hypothetical protein